ncbi:MAG: hypothetical protein HUU54_13730 [Ignavibacteriaceae bacterium]|nr:hypothetical protein [Ignavibacteriaceae bacterium]
MSEKSEIVDLLESIASILEFKGENPFKISAFRNAGNALRRYEGDYEALAAEGKLNEIKGIGKETGRVITEFIRTGDSTLYKEIITGIPPGVLDMFSIRGIGPKKISVLYNELKFESVNGLAEACRKGELAKVKGFGEKTQAKLLEEISKMEYNRQFVLMHQAERLSDKVRDILKSSGFFDEVSVSGEIRRNMEVVKELKFVVFCAGISETVAKTISLFVNAISEGEKIVVRDFSIPVYIHFSESQSSFVKQLFLTTGSEEFLKNIKATEVPEKLEEEKEIFSHIKMEFVAPEMREKEYFDITAKELRKSSDLEQEKLNGLLHFHTSASDGNNSLEEMAGYGITKGYSYFAVCDHSKNAAYANGLNEERILKQKELTRAVSEKLKTKVYQGIECDILTDGALDFSDDFLTVFDFIVASVHSQFNLSENDMTARIIRAVENPFTDAIGHPTGRLLLARDGYKVNIKKIIDACAANSVAIEINANPHRLDLDWRNVFYAREKGAFFTINADAHSLSDIDLTRYGLAVARKAGLQSSEVINCFSNEEFYKFLNRKVKRIYK